MIYNTLIGAACVGVVLVVVVFGVRTHQSSSSTNGTRTLQVVAAENVWGDVAGQLGGSRVHVISLITDSSVDPHLYEQDAHAAAVVGSAKLVIENGLGYDDFMDKLLGASPGKDRAVLSAARVLDASSNANPHLWYHTSDVKQVAAAIAVQLERVDTAHAAEYRQRLGLFNSSLQPLVDTVATIRQKYAYTPVAYTERVPAYLLSDTGLTVQTPAGFAASLEEGNDPSPADAAAMSSLIKNRKVRVLLYNAQVTSSATEQLQRQARSAGIPVVPITEMLPGSEQNFQSWQLDQAKALLAALGG